MGEIEAAYVGYIRDVRRLSPHTVRAYRDDVALLRAHVDQVMGAGTPWADVEAAAVRSFLADCLTVRGLSRKSASRKLSAVRSFFGYLVVVGEISADPSRRLAAPKLDERNPGFLTVGESEQLFATAEAAAGGGAFLAVRNLAIVELFYTSGIRLSELQALDREGVDLISGLVRVWGKGNKERIVPVGRPAVRALIAYEEARAELIGEVAGGRRAPLFVTRAGHRLSRRQVQRAVTALLADVAVGRKLSVHSLRHTMATHMIDAGASLIAVKELLGHESVRTTSIYTHTTPARLLRTYRSAHPRA